MDREQLAYFQRKLGVISQAYHTVGCVFPSGSKDRATKNAVKELQGMVGIKKSGEIDVETYTAAMGLAQRVYNEAVPVSADIFPCGRVYSLGDSDEVILLCQTMINAAAKRYSNILTVQRNGNLDETTATAISRLRLLFGLPVSSQIDALFFKHLLALYRNIKSN